MNQPCIYILGCSDGTYYTGCTNSLDKRLLKHEAGEADRYTALRRPVTLLWVKTYNSLVDATIARQKIRKWSRERKAGLIRGEFDLLEEFARIEAARKEWQRLKTARQKGKSTPAS